MTACRELQPVRIFDNGTSPDSLSADQVSLLRRYEGLTLRDWSDLEIAVTSPLLDHTTGEVDGVEDLPVFSLSGADENGWHLRAGNCMGVLRIRDGERRVQVEIRSRFDTGAQQYFLNYLLKKVFAGRIVDESIQAGHESVWDMLLALVFRDRLLEAVGYGLYRQYRTFEHNDLRFRGRLALHRHLQRNIPLCNAVAYETREITFDNELNHLLRHALARLQRKWPSLLRGNGKMSELHSELTQQTPTWRPEAVRDCLLACRQPVRHPYFRRHYEPLRRLAWSILRDEGANLYSTQHEVDGILFDGSWLWEKYVCTLLQGLGYAHLDNRDDTQGWRVLGHRFVPDFHRTSPPVVLDAKYAIATRQDHVSQVLAYMYMIAAKRGGVVRPSSREATEMSYIRNPVDNRAEAIGIWADMIVQVPTERTDYGSFAEGMQRSEEAFRKKAEQPDLWTMGVYGARPSATLTAELKPSSPERNLGDPLSITRQ